MKSVQVFLTVFLFVFSASADQILVISGGGNPTGNHFSQYLQTKTLFTYLNEISQPSSTNIYFGAGNKTNQSPLLADVHKVEHNLGKSQEIMISGFIENNHPATKTNIIDYFKSSNATTLTSSDTFFLFVSDHGMPNRNAQGEKDKTFSNNCIDTWAFSSDLAKQEFSSFEFPERCLSKNELKSQLQNLNSKKTVFSMSQCYSGGFHQMSIDKINDYPVANTKICGFTAITKDTTASGCTPDVDGPGYQGYERYFTENLTGLDVVSGNRLRQPRLSIQEAHRAATIQDLTKDIPLATSDSYLMNWFDTISSSSFIARSGTILLENIRTIMFQSSLPGKIYSLDSTAYKSKSAFFYRAIREISRLYPELQNLLYGSLADLQKLAKQAEADFVSADDAAYTVDESLAQAEDQLAQAWADFTRSGKSNLSEYTLILEDNFAAMDKKYGYGTGADYALKVMSIKAVIDPAKAELISQYKSQRIDYAIDWATKTKDVRLVSLTKRIQTLKAQSASATELVENLNKRAGHIRRILLYRQILGAWNALFAMNDQTALAEVNGLIDCEETKLTKAN